MKGLEEDERLTGHVVRARHSPMPTRCSGNLLWLAARKSKEGFSNTHKHSTILLPTTCICLTLRGQHITTGHRDLMEVLANVCKVIVDMCHATTLALESPPPEVSGINLLALTLLSVTGNIMFIEIENNS